MSNVVIKKQYAAFNVDAYNRSGVYATSNLDNGCVCMLESQGTNVDNKEVWTATVPAAATATGVWMIHSPEIPIISVTVGGVAQNFKGITSDPRAFTNIAGLVFDAFLPQKGDIIEMTGDGITDIATSAYLNVGASNTLVAASSAGAGFSMKKIGTGTLAIGQAGIAPSDIPTYKYQVTNN